MRSKKALKNNVKIIDGLQMIDILRKKFKKFSQLQQNEFANMIDINPITAIVSKKATSKECNKHKIDILAKYDKINLPKPRLYAAQKVIELINKISNFNVKLKEESLKLDEKINKIKRNKELENKIIDIMFDKFKLSKHEWISKTNNPYARVLKPIDMNFERMCLYTYVYNLDLIYSYKS